MKTLNKLFAAATAAASLLAFAAPSQAAQVIASQTYTGQGPDFTWTNNGVSGAGAGGTLTGVSSSLTDYFSFIDPVMAGALFIPADFALSASTTAGPATFTPGGALWTQQGLNGSFSFTYNGANALFGGHLITTGSNLLSGTFTGGWIQGNGASGSTNLSIGNGGSACFTSDYLSIGCGPTSKNEYSFSLLSVSPDFGASPNQGLSNFAANGQGVFSVPEPTTWALMIMGFGGVGALLRNRRRQGVAFA